MMIFFGLQYMNEASWNWKLMKTIFTDCHIYDPELNYVSFERAEKSSIISVLRKIMPPLSKN